MAPETRHNTLILFLGNPLFSDDKIGLVLGERLREKLLKQGVDVEILVSTGFTIIDHIEGYEQVIIIDAIHTGKLSPGEVVVLGEDHLKGAGILTPHYTGIPEALEVMRLLGLRVPKKVSLIGIEVVDPYTVSDKMTPQIASRLEEIVKQVEEKILSLLEERDA